LSLAGFGARGGRLYFLLNDLGHSERPPRSVVVITDTSGRILTRFDYPQRLQELNIDQSGEFLARCWPSRDLSAVVVWDANGTPIKTLYTKEAHPLGFHAGHAVSLVGSMLTHLDPSVAELDFSTPAFLGSTIDYSFLALSGTRSMIIGKRSGDIDVLEGNSALRTVRLVAPEVQGTAQDSRGNQLTVFSAAADEAGRVYAGITGHFENEGPGVLQLDSAGHLLRRLRCTPPSFPPPAEAAANEIAVTGRSLFMEISDQYRHSVITWYSFEDQERPL
jgi:hypothetical protein